MQKREEKPCPYLGPKPTLAEILRFGWNASEKLVWSGHSLADWSSVHDTQPSNWKLAKWFFFFCPTDRYVDRFNCSYHQIAVHHFEWQQSDMVRVIHSNFKLLVNWLHSQYTSNWILIAIGTQMGVVSVIGDLSIYWHGVRVKTTRRYIVASVPSGGIQGYLCVNGGLIKGWGELPYHL